MSMFYGCLGKRVSSFCARLGWGESDKQERGGWQEVRELAIIFWSFNRK